MYGRFKKRSFESTEQLINAVPERKKVKVRLSSLIIISATLIFVGLLVYLGPATTGFATFSESVVNTDNTTLSVALSGTRAISTGLDSINALLLSGTVHGSGKAAVFLVLGDRKFLAYYFEGDARNGVNFIDMCSDTCHIQKLAKENTLLFELEGTSIDIDRIKYINSRIIDFELEPKEMTIDYNKEPAKIINLKLRNSELADYSVLLYIDGPLSSSFAWQGSLVHMAQDEPEKEISITVRLPTHLPPGEYVHKITARYVPPGEYEFVGESPVSEAFVTVISR